MRKGKPKPKLCVFCGRGKESGPLSREHFVPKGLWAGERPKFTKTVPAHVTCNNKYADDNDYFRDVIVSHYSVAKHPIVKQLINEKLRRKLRKRRQQMARTFNNLRRIPIHSAHGIYLGVVPGFDVEWPRLERVVQNIVRGVYYTVKEQPPSPTTEFDVRVITQDLYSMCAEIHHHLSDWQSFGDDVFACRYFFSEDPNLIYCETLFYRSLGFATWAAPSLPAAAESPFLPQIAI